MKHILFAVLTGVFMQVHAQVENFDSARIGTLPDGWKTGVTGKGSGHWAVNAGTDAPSKPNVLSQTGKGDFPWCVKNGVALADGFVEVKFKPVGGKEDQAGGVVWRWKDGDNYYVARANALENNVSLYYTTNGRRNTIKYVNAPVPANKWHTLRVEFRGADIQVMLDGKTYIEMKGTQIAGAGSVGMWTKADSVTEFDDFRYGNIDAVKGN
jgi:hypothetical protein